MSTWPWEDESANASASQSYPYTYVPDASASAALFPDEESATAQALSAQGLMAPAPTSQSVTTKIPPSYNGGTIWFAYEEQVLEWEDLTELAVERRGPALKSRLEGPAAIVKPFLDRDQLKQPDGVADFLKTARPHFIKGKQTVFL